MTSEQQTRLFAQIHGSVRSRVSETVQGYDDVVTDLMIGLLARGHVMLEGVPGLAKTSLAKAFAHITGLGFRRIQFTQDLLPADITGHFYFNQKEGEFQIRQGPVFTNVLLADEINRSPPKTQSALLEAMEELQVTIEGQTFPVNPPFMVIATLNPIDVEGVYRLPEAQLDRFMLRTSMDYLSKEAERAMLSQKLSHPAPRSAPQGFKLDAQTIEQGRRAVPGITITPEVLRYLHDVCLATRNHPHVTLGASPRAMEQMMRASQAHAILNGRGYVVPDDVKRVAKKCLEHRMILDVDAEIEGLQGAAILEEILGKVPVPKGLAPQGRQAITGPTTTVAFGPPAPGSPPGKKATR